MNDPLVYPVAKAFIPYGSPIRIAGLTAAPCPPEDANGEALNSSFNGETTGYAQGAVIRARFLPEASV